MNWRQKLIAVSIAAFIVPRTAMAQTGYDLFARCQHSENRQDTADQMDTAICGAFLSGVWSSALSVARLTNGSALFCPPETQVGQIVLIFRRWAREHPQDLNRDQTAVALAAFADTFPCNRRR